VRQTATNDVSFATSWRHWRAALKVRRKRFLANPGIASVYSDHHTASGERMSSGAMTAAHRTLPFGTKVTVLNRSNGRSAVVRINDRGPFVPGRVIDLSPAAAQALKVNGLASVSLIVERVNDLHHRKLPDDATEAPPQLPTPSPLKVIELPRRLSKVPGQKPKALAPSRL
jgi:rare lipoprotein A